MMKRITIATLAVLLLAAVPGVAVAQESPPATSERSTVDQEREATRAEVEAAWVEKIKARALEAIDKRLKTLAELESAISSSEAVSEAHAAVLLEEVRASTAGLSALAEEIAAAGDLETLRTLVPKIFEDYRIYAVVAPKVYLVLTADAAAAVADRLGEVAGSIADVLDRLEEAGFEVDAAEELLAEMERLVASGADGAAKVPGMVIDLEPSDYPASNETLRSAHETLKGAGGDLREAGQTAHEIGRYIKSLFESDED